MGPEKLSKATEETGGDQGTQQMGGDGRAQRKRCGPGQGLSGRCQDGRTGGTETSPRVQRWDSLDEKVLEEQAGLEMLL